MAQFTEIKALVQETGILSFDLETTSRTEDPDDAKVPMRTNIDLVAISSGKGAKRASLAVNAGEDIYEFLRTYLTDPNITVVGHNHIGFDYEVLHYNGVINYTDIKAKSIDTLLWSWLYDENMDHRLKPCVEKFFNYKMVTYEEAYLFSPARKRIEELQRKIKEIEKNDIGRAAIRARKQRAIDKKSLEADFKAKFAGRRTKADNEEKALTRLQILNHLDRKHGEAAVEAQRLKIREEKIVPLEDEIKKYTAAWRRDKKNYAADDAAQTSRLYYRLGRELVHYPNLANWSKVMHEVRAAAARTEMNGIMIDTEYLEKLDTEFDKLVGEFEARIHDIARVPGLNPRSPKQLEYVMYDILAIEPLAVMEKGKWVVKRSTAEHVLSRMSHPIAQAILDYRAIQKLQSTYIKSIYEKVHFDGLGRLFGHLNTTGAVTGRWSSSGPNLQNIPSRSKPAQYDERIQNLGPKIRRAFIAPPGRKLICADLSQIELRLIAHFTEDVNLIDVYTQCEEYEGITFYTGDIHHNTSTNLDLPRKIAKNCNFGLCYGMWAPKFARYAKLYTPQEDGTKILDVDAAAKHRDGFFRLYPGIMSEIMRLEETRDTKNPFGKIQTTYTTLSGRFRRFPQKDFATGGKILNSRIQGSAADILNLIVIMLYRYIIDNPMFTNPKLIMQVHDEICIECEEYEAHDIGVLTKYIMEQPWLKIAVPILASVKICDTWADNNSDDVPEVGLTPSADSGIRAAVAMLSEEDKAWAARYVPYENFNPKSEEYEYLNFGDGM